MDAKSKNQIELKPWFGTKIINKNQETNQENNQDNNEEYSCDYMEIDIARYAILLN